MAPLSADQRKLLEKAIVKARQSAEAGAKKALEMLAVDRHEPHASMSTDERALRNRLRARGRQLGDVRDMVRGTQSIDRLAHEVAYECWHRMLFARLLFENHLLIEPCSGVAISMEECEELAREEGVDPRLMAARFAQESLPQIFRSGDPVLEVTLAPETSQALDKLLDDLPAAIFTADDSLGWTYQYWQAEKKDVVNASGNKIGADELPAVTQLFTEHYMVLFLYHNTIGAWHAGRVLAENPGLAETAQNEDELRQAVRLQSLGGYDFKYLRFVREMVEGDDNNVPTGPWRPAAGTFSSWPKAALELKVLDPCCGSGHFLTEGFELLVRLRMDEEGLDLEGAIHGVLSNNLHGLELDPRCAQIAAFNLALAAWKMAYRPITLPALHIACSGLAVGSTKGEWAKLAGNNERLRNGMEKLYDLFEQAPELGSLIDPKAIKGDLFEASFAELAPLLNRALSAGFDDPENAERAVAAQGMMKAEELLSSEYTLTITNVPYLARGQQGEQLQQLAYNHFNEAKSDLATVFLQRLFRFICQVGTTASVTPQSWLLNPSYRVLRESLLKIRTFNLVARLGPGAFEAISGEVVNVALCVISGPKPSEDSVMAGLDVSAASNSVAKASLLLGAALPHHTQIQNDSLLRAVSQSGQYKNPDHRLTLSDSLDDVLLSEHADCGEGLSTGDADRYICRIWELCSVSGLWAPLQGGVRAGKQYDGLSQAVRWECGKGELASSAGARIQGHIGWGKKCVVVSEMSDLPRCLHTGVMHDKTMGVVVPKDNNNLPAIWSYCESPEYVRNVRAIDKGLKVTPKSLIKVPFNLKHWQKVAEEKYPNGLPEPESNDPTQLLFHGHPAGAEPATVLQVAIGRLLGYRWPPELDREMHLADEAREWVSRCTEFNEFIDEDGIVCLSATRGERSASERIRELLSVAFGQSWSPTKERELLSIAGDGKRPAASLEVWLRDKFFEEHCKLFHHRPFVWHIWDGNREGFHCLVNAHKLTGTNGEGRRTLEALTYSYLGDWIDRQKTGQAEDKEGVDARLAAAHDLQAQLVKILEGEPPYDLFVRWKPLHEQAIGWDPDIDDGIRLNIRPFMNAELRKGGKKGAGILRWKPNIKWKKDRGKEPQGLRPRLDFPWFRGCEDGALDFTGGGEFDGNRWNNLHYSRAVKEASQERTESRS